MGVAQAANDKKKTPDNLFLRNGVWWIRYNVNGRKIRTSLHTKSLNEAKRLRDQILGKRTAAAKFGLEAPVPKRMLSFREVIELWLQSRKATGDLRPGTLELSNWRVNYWLLPEFGNKQMDEISVEDMERFIARLRTAKSRLGKPLSQMTIHDILCTVRSLYRLAAKRGWYTGPCPMDQLERLPSRGRGREVKLTVEEARMLISMLADPALPAVFDAERPSPPTQAKRSERSNRRRTSRPRLPASEYRATYYKVALALATGLRWGEVHGLAWEDIALDAEQPTLTVKRSYDGPPKNEASAATIPLSAHAAALLRRWKAEQGGGAFVFPDRRGNLRKREPSRITGLIQFAARQAGITKHVTPHVFRHSFGTWVYEQTKDVMMVKRLLRHATYTSSLVYVHDDREMGHVVDKLPVLVERALVAV